MMRKGKYLQSPSYAPNFGGAAEGFSGIRIFWLYWQLGNMQRNSEFSRGAVSGKCNKSPEMPIQPTILSYYLNITGRRKYFGPMVILPPQLDRQLRKQSKNILNNKVNAKPPLKGRGFYRIDKCENLFPLTQNLRTAQYRAVRYVVWKGRLIFFSPYVYPSVYRFSFSVDQQDRISHRRCVMSCVPLSEIQIAPFLPYRLDPDGFRRPFPVCLHDLKLLRIMPVNISNRDSHEPVAFLPAAFYRRIAAFLLRLSSITSIRFLSFFI